MYPAWSWGGTTTAGAVASPTAASFVQPAATAVQTAAATQWPANYNQYAAVTPEMQQQWAAAWASQAQFAYTGGVPVAGQVPTTAAAYSGLTESQPQTTTTSSQSAETPKTSTEEPTPRDSTESEKIKKLQEQAQQWKSLQQPAASSWSPSPTVTGASVTTAGEPLKSNAVANTNVPHSNFNQQLDPEEAEFDRQFEDWEKQFATWKEQNINHPDKEAFAQYEKQWQEWRVDLLKKKEQMRKTRAERLATKLAQSTNTTVPSTVAAVTTAGTDATVPDPNAAANPGLYYPQYMYMQPPYVFPGAMPGPPTGAMPGPPTGAMPGPPTGAMPGPPTGAMPGPPTGAMPGPPAGAMPGPPTGAMPGPPTGAMPGPPTGAMPAPPTGAMPPPGPGPMHTPVPGGPPPPQQFPPFGGPNADGYGAQPPPGPIPPSHMNAPIANMNAKEQENDMYNFGPNSQNFPPPPHQGEQFPPHFDDYGNPNMYPPPPEGNDQFQRDMDFGRGRGVVGRGRIATRGRGRGRGRGRWSDPNDMENAPPDMRNPGGPALLDNPPDFPPPQGPPGNFRGEGGDFREGEFPPGPGGFPPDRRNFPPGPRGPRDFPPPNEFHDGPKDNQPPFDFPPDEFRGDFNRDMPFPDRGGRGRNNFPPNGRFPGNKQPLLARDGPPLNDGPLIGDRPEDPPSSRFPPEEFDDQFNCGPPPPFDEGFNPDSERFPPNHPRSKNGRFMMDREFQDFPPEGEFGPPPQFREDFPPFENRFPPGRGGRFPARGRRFPGRGGGGGDFDRFGPPNFPPGMRDDEAFGPGPGPDGDRFPFPGDGPPPPRMGGPHGRGGMRPPFEPPGFGGPGGRFEDEPFREGGGGGGPPMRFKSMDYSHRPSEDFNPHYEYESEFQDDVGQFRANAAKRNKRPPSGKEPVEKKSRD